MDRDQTAQDDLWSGWQQVERFLALPHHSAVAIVYDAFDVLHLDGRHVMKIPLERGARS